MQEGLEERQIRMLFGVLCLHKTVYFFPEKTNKQINKYQLIWNIKPQLEGNWASTLKSGHKLFEFFPCSKWFHYNKIMEMYKISNYWNILNSFPYFKEWLQLTSNYSKSTCQSLFDLHEILLRTLVW